MVFLNTRRNGYEPSQCTDRHITVGELIDILKGYDEDEHICLRNDNGYTYGDIDELSFSTDEDEAENDEQW